MAYAYQTTGGRTYYLHGKPVVPQNGRPMTVYYFASVVKPREGVASSLLAVILSGACHSERGNDGW